MHLFAAAILALGPAITGDTPTKHVAGGAEVEECGWPDTVAVTGGGGLCTGSLVHPRLVVYAAHCGDDSKQIRFGESSTGSAYTRQTERCVANPEYLGVSNQTVDWAFCILAEPVTEIPITPPLFGCEEDMLQEGSQVVIAGFGQSVGGSAGTKRWATTEVRTIFGDTVNIGGDGTSTCMGDSGGSAFLQMSDGSWRSFSITSTGTECGAGGVHALMPKAIEWIESESQIDITPCHDLDGTWRPTPNCEGFFAGSQVGSGTWVQWCDGTPSTGPATTCGEPWTATEDLAAPTVTISSPEYGEELASGTSTSIVIAAQDEGMGVRHVWISINGDEQPDRDEYPPYDFVNVTFPDGLWTIVAFAEDWAGNIAESDPVVIGVNEPVPEPETTGDPDGDSGDEEGDGTSDDTGGGGSGASDSGGDDGCSCRATTPAPASLVVLLLVLIARSRPKTPHPEQDRP